MVDFKIKSYHITLLENPLSDIVVYMVLSLSDFNDLKPYLFEPIPNMVLIDDVNWERDLSPWAEKKVFKGGNNFLGEADAFLSTISDLIVPKIEEILPKKEYKFAIAGYSLAGLFSLYVITKSNLFSYALSMSGSLWYPNFIKYLEKSPISQKTKAIYLSLGDTENKTNNLIMKSVLDNTIKARDIFIKKGIMTSFHMNNGGHFNEVSKRIADGINYLISF